LASWTRAQAARVGLSLDAAAAKALVGLVGERQQRLLRELEKLALEGDGAPQGEPGAGTPPPTRTIGVDQIESRAAHSAEWRAFSLADALIGADPREATRRYLHLREQGERLSGLIYIMAQRLREALAISLRLEAGESTSEVRRGLRMPSRAAERLLSDVARTDAERLRRALATLADLELDSRGGAPITATRSPLAALGEDTVALRAIGSI
ncbi:MAG: hypothetical protein M3Z95_09230, partial [Actinomycetota bacterium]|nr:hypothetical protein [Actinomycetota bacterium]